MKKMIVALVLFAVCISAVGFRYSELLTQEDIEFQELDNSNGVALGAEIESEWPWGSYNQWQCFSVENLRYDCADYDNGTLVPSLSIVTQQELLLFDVHVEDRLDCKQTLSQWRTLIDGGREVCIFAAHMPDVEMESDGDRPQSLWYINRIKGVRGYWNLFEEDPGFRTEN